MNIDANGLSLYVEVHGDGPPVLLLHGFPDSGRLWRHQVPALVAACHRVIVPDLRGFGRSARPSEVDAYPMPVILGGIDRLLTALEVGRTAMVGHDRGAGGRYERLEDAGHWFPLGAPDAVNRLPLEFLSSTAVTI